MQFENNHLQQRNYPKRMNNKAINKCIKIHDPMSEPERRRSKNSYKLKNIYRFSSQMQFSCELKTSIESSSSKLNVHVGKMVSLQSYKTSRHHLVREVMKVRSIIATVIGYDIRAVNFRVLILA